MDSDKKKDGTLADVCQTRSVIPFPERVTVNESLTGARIHLAQAKLLLCRTRHAVRDQRARTTLDHLAMGCDTAIESLTLLAHGAGGKL